MSESAFWRFSLQFYALPGVAAACIDLQDRHGVDVNVLLFLLFLAQAKRALSPADVARIEAEVRGWREGIIVPIRTVRRNLRNAIGMIERDAAETLRTDVKRIELQAERIQQETLERLFPALSIGTSALSRESAARTNLVACGRCLGGLPDGLLAPLLRAFDADADAPH
jgi:uncharacterized protein (TIGR02444 family)